MISLNAKQFLFVLVAVIACVGSARAQSDTNCEIGGGGDKALLECYQSEFRIKSQGNDAHARDLIRHAKAEMQDALLEDDKKLASQYVDLIHGINQTLVQSRREATPACFRMASKFKSDATSTIAAVNCRTESEVKVERALHDFEDRLESLIHGGDDAVIN